MALPKIDYPIHLIEIPSLKKQFRFRPFLVKEEKILLMAKEGGNPTDMLEAIKQVVNNSLIDKLDIDKLSLFDIEWLFIKLRSVSVDNIVKLSYKDLEDEKNYEFDVNLEDVKIIFPENADNNIKINDDTGILMKYPTAGLYTDKLFLSLEKDHMFELIVRCVDKIYHGDDVYTSKDFKRQELVEFLEGLNVSVFDDIQKYLLGVPKLNYEIKYKNSKGSDRLIVLNSLNDFFTWR